MADDDFESFDNLDDLDWSDVEEELKANREQILAAAQQNQAEDDPEPSPAAAAPEPAAMDMGSMDFGGMGGGGGGGPQGGVTTSSSLEIDALLDVKLEVSVEVGRTRLLISDLLDLEKSSIVELAKLVGDPLDIRVNEKLVARGEVVVINDKFAVRINEIISPTDRFAML